MLNWTEIDILVHLIFLSLVIGPGIFSQRKVIIATLLLTLILIVSPLIVSVFKDLGIETNFPIFTSLVYVVLLLMGVFFTFLFILEILDPTKRKNKTWIKYLIFIGGLAFVFYAVLKIKTPIDRVVELILTK